LTRLRILGLGNKGNTQTSRVQIPRFDSSFHRFRNHRIRPTSRLVQYPPMRPRSGFFAKAITNLHGGVLSQGTDQKDSGRFRCPTLHRSKYSGPPDRSPSGHSPFSTMLEPQLAQRDRRKTGIRSTYEPSHVVGGEETPSQLRTLVDVADDAVRVLAVSPQAKFNVIKKPKGQDSPPT
jgi:hypothetical protein